MGKRLGAILLAVPLSCAGLAAIPRTLTASAGTNKYPERAVLSGAILLEGDGSVLERQDLTLHIGDLPAEEGGAYESYMTSSLTFYNPGEEAVSLELAYPCPSIPGNVQTRACTVALGGQPLDPAIFHSYAGYYDRTLDVEGGVAQIGGSPSGFYQNETPVKQYTFAADLTEDVLAGADRKHLSLAATFDCDPAVTRVISCSAMNFQVVNGRLQVIFGLKEGQNRVDLTVAGEDISDLSYAVYTDPACTKALTSKILCATATSTFGEYALSFYPDGCRVSREDWVSGLMQMLYRSTVGGCVVYGKPCNLREEAFLEWYRYTVVLPPKTRSVHTVSAPVYPAAENDRYRFDILLSPLACWPVPQFSVELETPYHLAYSNLEFQQNGEMYTFSRDRLPLGELSFTLTKEEGEEASFVGGYNGISPSMRLAFILLGVLGGLALIGGGVTAVVLIQKKRRK